MKKCAHDSKWTSVLTTINGKVYTTINGENELMTISENNVLAIVNEKKCTYDSK